MLIYLLTYILRFNDNQLNNKTLFFFENISVLVTGATFCVFTPNMTTRVFSGNQLLFKIINPALFEKSITYV